MKGCYAVIFLWLSMNLFFYVALPSRADKSLEEHTQDTRAQMMNPRDGRINDRRSESLGEHVGILYREMRPSGYGIWGLKPSSGLDSGFQPESNMAYDYAAVSQATVVDDEGKPITEWEIRAYMINDYKTGCCLLGGVVGSGASFLLGCVAGIYVYDRVDQDLGVATWLAIWGAGTVGSALVGSNAGKEIDRRKAIERIKEARRTGEAPSKPKRTFLPSVVIGLGVVGATVLIIGVAGN